MKPSTPSPRIIALSTEIGRGHPHYLDCVCQALEPRLRPGVLSRTTVFELSRGASFQAWLALQRLYRLSARNDLFIRMYNALRKGQSASGSHKGLLGLLGRGLRRELEGFQGILLVEHQLTARMLSDVCRTWYVHADVAAPPECSVSGPERIFVPLEETERRFLSCGRPGTQLTRTGLVIDPDLIPGAHDAFHQRLARLASNQPLSIAFFSSGASPAPHIRKIVLAVESVLKQGMQAAVFCGSDPELVLGMVRQARRWKAEFELDGVPTSCPEQRVPPAALTIVTRPDRRADTSAAARLLPSFDVFVAPAHERVNWALGLGLPLFALFPMIGTHAEFNYEFAFRQNVSFPLRSDDDARGLGATLVELRRSGALANMVKCGFGRFPIDGSERAAREVIAALPGESLAAES